MFIIICQIQTE